MPHGQSRSEVPCAPLHPMSARLKLKRDRGVREKRMVSFRYRARPTSTSVVCYARSSIKPEYVYDIFTRFAAPRAGGLEEPHLMHCNAAASQTTQRPASAESTDTGCGHGKGLGLGPFRTVVNVSYVRAGPPVDRPRHLRGPPKLE